MAYEIDVRPSPIAGQWYPSDPRRLAEDVDAYIRAAGKQELAGEVIGIIVPHAGHRYSGPVAGFAYSVLQGLKPEVVAIVSPMHYPYNQPLLTSAHQAYATPLGVVPIAEQALQALDRQLQDRLGYSLARVRKDPEHALEIEIPFLQKVLASDFRLLPVMMRDQSARVSRSLGQALAEVLKGTNSLLVASSDLSHFYPQSVAEQLDTVLLQQVEAFDPSGVLQVEEEGKAYACGRGAIASVLWAAREMGADQAQILRYATSGDVTGDYEQVVGYGAAVLTRSADSSS